MSPHTIWRIIPPEPASGPWNMAVDEALLEVVATGRSGPVLRFYTWNAPWFSIGCAQRLRDDIRVDRVWERGIGLLRRASGGTAVLHADQVGFALVLPDHHPLASPDIVESYERLGLPVATALARLGLPVRAVGVAEARGAVVDPVGRRACFGSLSPYETVVDDGSGGLRKLTGHGQVRRRGVVMHHVVLSWRFDAGSLASLLRTTDEVTLASFLARNIASLADCGLTESALPTVVESIAGSLGAAGNGWLEQSALSEAERLRANELIATKYGDDAWLCRL